MYLEKGTSKHTTGKFLIVVCIMFWLVGFTYLTGFGTQYNIFETAKTVTIGFCFLCFLFNFKKYRLGIETVLAAAITFYIAMTNEVRYGNYIEDYVWVWLIIPIMKSFTVEGTHIKWIGFIFGIASTAVLLIGNVTDVFSGWDGNSVSMVQFFSYTVFMSIFSEIKDKKNIRNLVIFSIAYFMLLNKFESRSAILFSIIMLLCMLSVIPLRKYLNKYTIILMLLVPLIIAIIIACVNEMGVIDNINKWSLDTFDKPIFNGRDALWERGFETWRENPLIGNGDLSFANYHNSAISALVGGGGIGYLLIISICYRVLRRGLKWKDDKYVYGLSVSFLIIWMQQSVELGIISATPNVIPYMILGLIYARTITLEGKKDELVDNNTDLQHR